MFVNASESLHLAARYPRATTAFPLSSRESVEPSSSVVSGRRLLLLAGRPIPSAMSAADDGDVGRVANASKPLKFKGRFLDQLATNSRVQIIWKDDDDIVMLAFLARRRITEKNEVDDLEEDELAELAASLGYKQGAARGSKKHWAAVRRRIKTSLAYKLGKLKQGQGYLRSGLSADKTLEVWEWPGDYRNLCLKEEEMLLERRREEDGAEEQDEEQRGRDVDGQQEQPAQAQSPARASVVAVSEEGGIRRDGDEPGASPAGSATSSSSSSSDSDEDESSEGSDSDGAGVDGNDGDGHRSAAAEVLRLRHGLIERAARRRLEHHGIGGRDGRREGRDAHLWGLLATAMDRLKMNEPLRMEGLAMMLIRRAERVYR
ncbi:hypothetical protein CkaCkLH20_12256 [Colletotrichum karsti]|uniref:Uncharacterized protein n=1 Tax=Colletotrichum karsti TaxID=1095194 RepID=A0A9P6HUV7_9PEZI|nr:uncharacterized protein CkaCkLH20_12256 [Colletotrichum karsti]KAF9870292.1 hypothetical protein CkaCkLH20_12256 [Colletotrichum karsti]